MTDVARQLKFATLMKVDNVHLLGAQSMFMVHDYLNLPHLLPAAPQGGVRACLGAGLATSVYLSSQTA